MIYLDSAATSLRKPPEVGLAVKQTIYRCASPGRGTHEAAMHASEIVYACREEVAALFHLDDPTHIIFTSNATHALNIAIRTLVKPGDRVVVSAYEHNAVMRPLYALGADVQIASAPLFAPDLLLSEFRRMIPGAAAVICTHISNVFGFVLPIGDIAALCREHGVPLIIDAAQSAGMMEIDFSSLGAEYIAMPGHKGLLGPQGTGILLCRDTAEPILYGGTGNLSESREMPGDLPERVEAGTHNVCGIAGLMEGIRYIRRVGLHSVRRKEEELLKRLIGELSIIPGLEVFSEKGNYQMGVLSVRPKNGSCETMAEILGRRGVAVRSGLHCAPLAHRTAGTIRTGTVRFSVSPFNSAAEMDAACRITENILKNSYKL